MKPESCKNCCASEFIELDDAYVCAYCNSRYHKPAPQVVTGIRYREVPIVAAVQECTLDPIPAGKPKNKWIAFFLCLFLGFYGGHKFYEGRIGMGILYFFTAGLCGLGWLVDCIILLTKPNPYYVA